MLSSKEITEKINRGDLSLKPGWVRLSLHPTMTDAELDFFVNAINEIIENIDEWQKDYVYNPHVNEFKNKRSVESTDEKRVVSWFGTL